MGLFFALLIMGATIYYSTKGFKITEPAYYYTLSTIAQTLAAMIAFTGMFVVFRLQILKDKRENLYNELEYLAKKAKDEPHPAYIEVPPYYNELFNLYDLDDETRIKRLSIFLGNISQINTNLIPHEIRGLIKDVEKKIKQINEIKGEYSETKNIMIIASICSIATIMTSIFLLGFYKPWPLLDGETYEYFSMPFSGVGVVVALSGLSIVEIFKSFLRFMLVD